MRAERLVTHFRESQNSFFAVPRLNFYCYGLVFFVSTFSIGVNKSSLEFNFLECSIVEFRQSAAKRNLNIFRSIFFLKSLRLGHQMRLGCHLVRPRILSSEKISENCEGVS